MRFYTVLALMIGAVAAYPSDALVDRATSSECSPDGASAGATICNNPAYTGNRLKLNNQAFNLGGCGASKKADALCEARDN